MHLGIDVSHRRWRQIKSGMLTGCKIKRLKMIYLSTSGKTGKKSEILDFIESKYPMYAWSGRTLARRLQYFDIKFTDYEVDIEDVKEAVRREMDGPGQLLGYRSMQQKVREIHGLNVPRDVVYAVMKEVSPEGLQARGGVGKAKRHQRTNTYVTGVSRLLSIFYLK